MADSVARLDFQQAEDTVAYLRRCAISWQRIENIAHFMLSIARSNGAAERSKHPGSAPLPTQSAQGLNANPHAKTGEQYGKEKSHESS